MLELARWEDRGDYGCLIQFPSFAKRRNSPERGGGLSGAVSKSGKMIALFPALCVAQSQHLSHLAHISSHCFIILVKGKHGNPKSHPTCSGISSSLVAFFSQFICSPLQLFLQLCLPTPVLFSSFILHLMPLLTTMLGPVGSAPQGLGTLYTPPSVLSGSGTVLSSTHPTLLWVENSPEGGLGEGTKTQGHGCNCLWFLFPAHDQGVACARG